MKRNSEAVRSNEILKRLKKEYPVVEIALEFGTPFQLLISTILSAQCTDARVNLVTKSLFKKYKKPEDYLQGIQSGIGKRYLTQPVFIGKKQRV